MTSKDDIDLASGQPYNCLVPPLPTDKFAVGNIVRYTPTPESAASNSVKAGATAIVLGYTNSRITRYGSSKRYVEVLWLSQLAGNQANGGYHEHDFVLHKEDFKRYRPDIVPEDRGIVTDYAQGQALQELARAVKMVRAIPDHEVACTVTVTKTITMTEKETRSL